MHKKEFFRLNSKATSKKSNSFSFFFFFNFLIFFYERIMNSPLFLYAEKVMYTQAAPSLELCIFWYNGSAKRLVQWLSKFFGEPKWNIRLTSLHHFHDLDWLCKCHCCFFLEKFLLGWSHEHYSYNSFLCCVLCLYCGIRNMNIFVALKFHNLSGYIGCYKTR